MEYNKQKPTSTMNAFFIRFRIFFLFCASVFIASCDGSDASLYLSPEDQKKITSLDDLQYVRVSSNNTTDDSYAKNGDIVTLRFAFKADKAESIVAESIKVKMNKLDATATPSADPSGDGQVYTATLTIGDAVPEGFVSFQIDYANTEEDNGQQTAVKDDSDGNVLVDRTEPEGTLAFAGLLSGEGTSFVINEKITVTLTVPNSETIASDGQVTFTPRSNNIPTVTENFVDGELTNNMWSKEVAFDKTTDYTVDVTFTDKAGNSGTLTNTPAISIREATAPTATLKVTPETVAKDGAFTLSLTANKALKAGTVIATISGNGGTDTTHTLSGSGTAWNAQLTANDATLPGTLPTTDATTNFTIRVAFEDEAGKSGSASGNLAVTTTGGNTQGPTASFALSKSSVMENEQFTITLTPADGTTITNATATIALASDAAQTSEYPITNENGTWTSASITADDTDLPGTLAIGGNNFTVTVKFTANGEEHNATPASSTLTVTKEDTTKPPAPTAATAALSVDYPDNAPRTTAGYAKAGDTVKVTVSGIDKAFVVREPSITIGAAQKTATVGDTTANSFTLSYVVQSGDTGAVRFRATLAVNNEPDSNTNEITAVTDTSSITVDTTAPDGSFVFQVGSANPTTSFLLNDNVSATFTAGEELHSATFTYSPSATPNFTSSDNTEWTGSVPSSLTGTAQTVTVTVALTDLAGNSGSASQNIIFSSETAPSGNAALARTVANGQTTTDGYARAGDTVNVTVSGIDKAFVVREASLSIGGTAVAANSLTVSPAIGANGASGDDVTLAYTVQNRNVGNVTFSVGLANDATTTTIGRISTASESITVDAVAPELTQVSLAQPADRSKVNSGNFSLDLTFSEDVRSVIVGAFTRRLSLTGTGNTRTMTAAIPDIEAVYDVSANWVSATFTDIAGNPGVATNADYSGMFTVDTTAPTATVNTEGKTSFPVTEREVTILLTNPSQDLENAQVTIQRKDGTGGSYMRALPASWESNFPINTNHFPNLRSDGDTEYTISVDLTDDVGNARTLTHEITITRDGVAPTATVSVAPNSVNEGGTFTISLTNVSENLKANTVIATISRAGETATTHTLTGSGTNWSVDVSADNNDLPGTLPTTSTTTPFTISVAFQDVAGNAGTPANGNLSVTTTAVVTDSDAPTISSLTFASTTQGRDSGKIRAGETARLRFTVSDESVPANPDDLLHTVTIGGNDVKSACTRTGSDNSYTFTCNYAVPASFTGTSVNYSLRAQDSATTRNTTSERTGSLTIESAAPPTDTTAPTATVSVTPGSVNAGGTFTISLTGNENLRSGTVRATISGNGGTETHTLTGSNTSWSIQLTANNTTLPGTLPTTDATTDFTISVAFQDVAGNAGTPANGNLSVNTTQTGNAPFSPTSLGSRLKLWFDASNVETSGGNVTRLNDRSANNNHASAVTGRTVHATTGTEGNTAVINLPAVPEVNRVIKVETTRVAFDTTNAVDLAGESSITIYAIYSSTAVNDLGSAQADSEYKESVLFENTGDPNNIFRIRPKLQYDIFGSSRHRVNNTSASSADRQERPVSGDPLAAYKYEAIGNKFIIEKDGVRVVSTTGSQVTGAQIDGLRMFGGIANDTELDFRRDLTGRFAAFLLVAGTLSNDESTDLARYIQNTYGVSLGIMTFAASSVTTPATFGLATFTTSSQPATQSIALKNNSALPSQYCGNTASPTFSWKYAPETAQYYSLIAQNESSGAVYANRQNIAAPTTSIAENALSDGTVPPGIAVQDWHVTDCGKNQRIAIKFYATAEAVSGQPATQGEFEQAAGESLISSDTLYLQLK